MTIKQKLINWLAGEDLIGRSAHIERERDRWRILYRDLEQRVFDRDNGVYPGKRGDGLPKASFVGIHDYGKNVTREEALTFSRIDVPGAGVSVKVDKEGTVSITRDGKPIVVLPKKGGVN